MMKRYMHAAMLAATLLGSGTALADSAFSYQGRLEQAGSPVNGNVDLRFTLYDSASGGSYPVSGTGIINPLTHNGVNVADGRFTVSLDFGDAAFTGAQRWLRVEVKPAGSGSFAALTPRQPATPALNAIHAEDAALAQNVPNNNVGASTINTAQVQRRITGTCPEGQAIATVNADGSVTCASAPHSDITRIRGRKGIVGDGSSGSVALALDSDAIIASQIADNNITTSALADGAITSAKFAGGSVTAAKISNVAVQQRVTGTCPEGQVIRAISRFGAVTCGRTTWDGINNNVISATGATVNGGSNNTASGNYAVVNGGSLNIASGSHATVNGGTFNHATGSYSTVTGGAMNSAHGYAATVLGGLNNCAGGRYSLAMGRRAKVRPASNTGGELSSGCLNVPRTGAYGDEGTFIFADSQDADFISTGSNQFLVRAQGGVYFTKNDDTTASIPAGRFINTETGAYLTTGGTWTNSSSRVLKTAFAAVQPGDVLDKVLAMPLTTWEYIKAPEAGRHLGPIAEDFHALFGLGDRDDEISTSDAGGVALAAIQGLAQRQEVGIEVLAQRADDAQRQLRADIAVLRARISTLQHANTTEATP